MIKDIAPKNEKGRYHGYCEFYYDNGKVWERGVWFEGHPQGYCEEYDKKGKIIHDYYDTGYRVNGYWSSNNEEGYCYIWNRI